MRNRQKALGILKGLGLGLALIFASGIPVKAKDPVFHQNRDDMVRELTRQPVKYRSFMPAAKTRSIVVMEKKTSTSVTVVGSTQTPEAQGAGQEYETKTILVVDNQDVPALNLKIEFDTDSAMIRPSSHILLKELGLALASNELAGTDMLVAGHTDSDGADRYNLRLSLDRANAVKQYLSSHFNIPEFRLKIRGYGEAMPLASNSDPGGKQMNRRVEILIEN